MGKTGHSTAGEPIFARKCQYTNQAFTDTPLLTYTALNQNQIKSRLNALWAFFWDINGQTYAHVKKRSSWGLRISKEPVMR
jgi:hypothetical protein